MRREKETLFKEIARETIERYRRRLKQFGKDPRTLGWDTVENQWKRFSATLAGLPDLHSRTVLDIGCGFGDYLHFLRERNLSPRHYLGWDLNEDLLSVARKVFGDNPGVLFKRVDLFEVKEEEPVADVGVMLGLLNFNLRERMDNYEFAFSAIRRAFSLVREVLVVDFLSACRTPRYPAEDFVFYYRPERMLAFAFTLTPKVVLKHDYDPVPQREGMLFLYRDPEGCKEVSEASK